MFHFLSARSPIFLLNPSVGLPGDAAAVGGLVLALFAAATQLRGGRVPSPRDAEGRRRRVFPAGELNFTCLRDRIGAGKVAVLVAPWRTCISLSLSLSLSIIVQ